LTTTPLKKAEADREFVQFEHAERVLSKLRWLGMLSWAWMLSRRQYPVSQGWAWGIFAGSVLYTALADVTIRRTQRLRVVAAATTLCDSAIVTLMCLVTGGIHSDFYPYYYITVLAGSVRFGPRETFFALVLNTLCSALVFVAAPGPAYPPGDLLLEIYYMLFIALMSSWLSRLAREHYRRALRQGDRAGLLLAVNREITGTLDLGELLGRILRATAHVIPCRGAAVLLLDRSHETLERVLVTGDFPEPAPETVERSLREGMLREAQEAGARICNDPAVLAEQRATEPLPALAAGRVAILTMRRRDSLGFLVLVDKAGGDAFRAEDRDLLTAVADQAAVAIENARLVEDVLEARDRGQQLLWRLIHAEEEERKRLAGEIHDRMGACLFELYFSVRRCQERLGERDPEAADLLSRVASEAQAFADEIRGVMNELRPTVLDDFGLIEALREYVATLQAQGGLDVTLKIDEHAKPVRPEVNVMLFRVLQEAVLNVRKHAEARRLAVEWQALEGGAVSLTIRDDGRGFDPRALPRGHYGLLHMKERAEACGGNLDVRSQPNHGTEVRVTVADAYAA
jgi:signal transduction histidine kinase